jgi:hypothetical protein
VYAGEIARLRSPLRSSGNAQELLTEEGPAAPSVEGIPVPTSEEDIHPMDFLIVNFTFEGATEKAWEQQARQLAPRFAAMPNLLSKVWLADAASETYGGAYLWRDRASLDAYLASPTFAALGEIDGVHSIETRTFAALETSSLVDAAAS